MAIIVQRQDHHRNPLVGFVVYGPAGIAYELRHLAFQRSTTTAAAEETCIAGDVAAAAVVGAVAVVFGIVASAAAAAAAAAPIAPAIAMVVFVVFVVVVVVESRQKEALARECFRVARGGSVGGGRAAMATSPLPLLPNRAIAPFRHAGRGPGSLLR